MVLKQVSAKVEKKKAVIPPHHGAFFPQLHNPPVREAA